MIEGRSSSAHKKEGAPLVQKRKLGGVTDRRRGEREHTSPTGLKGKAALPER